MDTEPDIAYPFLDDDNAAACSPRRRLKVARIAAGLYSQAIVAPLLPEALSRRFVITRRLIRNHPVRMRLIQLSSAFRARWRKHTRFAGRYNAASSPIAF